MQRIIRGNAIARLGGIAVTAMAVLSLSTAKVQAQDQVQESESSPNIAEIVVTARKREESLLQAPVLASVMSEEQMADLKVTDLYALATVDPGLQIGPAFSSQGVTVYLRGLGNGVFAPFNESAVQLVVDDAPTTAGAFYKADLFDISRIETLRGPQSLYYGKSTTSGILALHSSDPTKSWEGELSTGYEFNGQESDVRGFVSGPLSDNLGIRVAAMWNHTGGWLSSPNPLTAGSLPDSTTYAGRITLKYDNPSVGVRANLKVTASHEDDNAPSTANSQFQCTYATPQNSGYPFDDCRLDQTTLGVYPARPYMPNLDYSAFTPAGTASFAVGNPVDMFRDGRPYSFTDTTQAVLKLEYDLARDITLTSVTAAGRVQAAESSGFVSPAIGYAQVAGEFTSNEYSTELRIATQFPGWINGVAGISYNPVYLQNRIAVVLPTLTLFTNNWQYMTSRALSGFGELTVTPLTNVELTAGVRYTNVDKFFTSLSTTNNYPAFIRPGPTGEGINDLPEGLTSLSRHDFSPEATLTYRPIDAVTTFVSYKQGWKGPGFNADLTTSSYATPAGASLSPVEGEKVKGVEGGIKALVLDNHLSTSLAAYHYTYSDLQVPYVNSANLSTIILNGSGATMHGVELAVTYQVPAINGLTLNSFTNYNFIDFTSFRNAPCYSGQTLAEGCFGTSQDLSHTQLPNAPRWVGQLGANYRAALTAGYEITITTNANYSSEYHTLIENNPNSYAAGYVTYDGSIRFAPIGGNWDCALIGRNLSNKYYVVPGAGDLGVVTPGVPGDVFQYVARPRQVMLQFTFHPKL
jgi:iron complex outermembrane receptor protein